MAKAAVNKSQLIREALAAHPEKTPVEISALMRVQGLKISSTYVSNVKHNLKKKRRRKRKGTHLMGRRANVHGAGDGMAGIPAALEFIKSAGGLAQAKEAIATVEEIGKSL